METTHKWGVGGHPPRAFSPLAGEELMETLSVTACGARTIVPGVFSPLAGEELMETPTRLLQSKPPPALLLYNEFLEEKELDVDELRSRNLIDDIVE